MGFESDINDTCISMLANATLTWAGGTASGLFEAAYQDPLSISSTQPMIECRTSEVALLAYGSAVTIQKTESDTIFQYTVAESQQDGRGVTRLFLK